MPDQWHPEWVPRVSTVEELERAAADFAVRDLALEVEPSALAAARRSVAESGLLLLGEIHGVRENPLVIRSIMRALGLRGLALEWHEDLAHTPTARTRLGVPLGAHLPGQRLGLREIQISYGGGRFYNIEPRQFRRRTVFWRHRARLRERRGGLVLDLPTAREAVVPQRPMP
jgi:hypothetical protein